MNFQHPAQQISDCIALIYNNGLTTTSGGNISIKDDDGTIWITPSAIDKGALTQKDIVKINPDGTIEGLHKPSSEYPFHLAIYKARPDIKAIIHAHPPALVSFSTVRQTPNTAIIPQAKTLCGEVGYAPYELPGSTELGESIAQSFAQGAQSVIMENHGTVVGGSDLQDTFMRFETLEFCARNSIRARIIGEVKSLSTAQIDEFEQNQNQYKAFTHNTPTTMKNCYGNKWLP